MKSFSLRKELSEADKELSKLYGLKWVDNSSFFFYWTNEINKNENLLNELYKIFEIDNLNKPVNGKTAGYIFHSYYFVSYIEKFEDWVENYNEVLELFGIEYNKAFPIEKIPLINNYRSLIISQIDKQKVVIDDINEKISDVLKVFIFEILLIVSTIEKNIADNFLLHFKMFYQDEILGGAPCNNIKEIWFKYGFHNTGIVNNSFSKATLDGVLFYAKKREPIIETAERLVAKLFPIESLVEDSLTQNLVISPKDFQLATRYNLEKYSNEHYWDTAYEYYNDSNNSLKTWELVYNKIKSEMKLLGLNTKYSSFNSFKKAKVKFDLNRSKGYPK